MSSRTACFTGSPAEDIFDSLFASGGPRAVEVGAGEERREEKKKGRRGLCVQRCCDSITTKYITSSVCLE